MTTSPATLWSRAFLGSLIAGGVCDIVISPGARSQALALAALEWERLLEGALTIHVVIDERSAAFRALGLSVESGVPAVCVATSGSAPAHYFPALLEAHHAGVGMIVVSADRPAELLGVGANQTTTQAGMFGDVVVAWDVPAPVDGEEGGASQIAGEVLTHALLNQPTHVNVAFREPLSSVKDAPQVLPGPPQIEPATRPPTIVSLDPQPGTLVVAGHGAGPAAEALAYALGAPLIAEVVSGSRFGQHLVPCYREVLSQDVWPGDVSRVVTLGRPTLSREVWALLSDASLQHIVVRRSEEQPANPTRSAQIVDEVTIQSPATAQQRSSWVKPWVIAGRAHHERLLAAAVPTPPNLQDAASEDPAVRSAFARTEMMVLRRPITRAELALAVWEATWPHDRLVLGASRMIREMDAIAGSKNIPVLSNRGLSGIDGTVSFARGVGFAAAREGASGITRVLLGDLAFLHDVGSLLREPGVEDRSRVHIIVANDGGGTIFDALEVSSTAEAKDVDRVLYTPHQVDIEAVAQAYGWSYVAPSSMGELHDALSRAESHVIVDVKFPR